MPKLFKPNIKQSFLGQEINAIFILMSIISLLGILVSRQTLKDNPVFSDLMGDTNKILLYYLTVPIILLFAYRDGAKLSSVQVSKLPIQTFLMFLMLNIISVLLVQIIPFLISGMIPQSQATMVTILFSSSGIAEEIFYRIFLIGCFQSITHRIQLDESLKKVVVLLIVFIQAFLFVLSHQNYYLASLNLVITFSTGIVQGIFYILHKNPLIIMVSHVFVNILAVQSIIPFL